MICNALYIVFFMTNTSFVESVHMLYKQASPAATGSGTNASKNKGLPGRRFINKKKKGKTNKDFLKCVKRQTSWKKGAAIKSDWWWAAQDACSACAITMHEEAESVASIQELLGIDDEKNG